MSAERSGVIVQESARGRALLCPTWRPVVVGSAEDADLRVRERGVAARHLQLTAGFRGDLTVAPREGEVRLEGRLLSGPRTVAPGARLALGEGPTLTVVGALDPTRPRREGDALRLPQELAPGYLALRVVGQGAAGVVLEGYDERRRRRVAIKLLLPGGRAHPAVVARFAREVELQTRLGDYPGIVSMLDHGTVPDTGELFCVMAYAPGVTLRERLRAGLPRLEGVRLVARVARAVAYAHEHGVLHRDLKPANVVVSAEGTVRLTDFGLCKALEDEEEGLTATGISLGTPCYMAPEQVEDAKRVGPPADVYALGAILYHALVGRLPFGGAPLRELLERVLAGDLEPPRRLDPTIDPELERVCQRAMARDPAARHSSALELARELEAWLRRADPPQRVSLR